ncbi:MAG: Bacteriocin-protection, YdeI or OmpD-Associated [Gaiellaceae bacterium]|jgi:uncharacterized protein YdeI (YjbR/CyaY-like superfamily)|nr:Bacteriocin-protection, YdeI or OmpD-Associated [Gaiellaceae bacterium]
MVSAVPAKSFTVELELAPEPGEVAIPRDLAAALAADSVARTFASMSFGPRPEHVEWVDEATRPETRARWFAATVARMRGGEPLR